MCSQPCRSSPRCSAIVAAAVALSLGLSASAQAQQIGDNAGREPRHTSGMWNGIYSKYRLNDQLFYHGEYHLRTRDPGAGFVRELSQVYLRFGLTWRVHESLELTGGIVTPLYWVPTSRTDDVYKILPQFRFWEQALFSQVLGRVKLYHQFRFEQRWSRDFARGPQPWALTTRYRYKVAAYIPLNHSRMVPRTFFLSPNNEIIMQAGRSISYNHFEDQRLTLAMGYIISPNLQIQLGYMWTYRHSGDPYRYEHRHLPRISLYHNTDFGSILDWFSP